MNIQSFLLGLGALAALTFYGWVKRGKRIDSLQNQLELQPGQLELNRLKAENDEKSKQSDIDKQDYDNLVASNPDLAAKLGLGRDNKPNPS